MKKHGRGKNLFDVDIVKGHIHKVGGEGQREVAEDVRLELKNHHDGMVASKAWSSELIALHR